MMASEPKGAACGGNDAAAECGGGSATQSAALVDPSCSVRTFCPATSLHFVQESEGAASAALKWPNGQGLHAPLPSEREGSWPGRQRQGDWGL